MDVLRMWFLMRRIRKLNNSLHLYFIEWYKEEWQRESLVDNISNASFRRDIRISISRWFRKYSLNKTHNKVSDFILSLIRKQKREISESIDGCIDREFVEPLQSNQIKLTQKGKEFSDSFLRLLNTILLDAEFGKISSFLFGVGFSSFVLLVIKLLRNI